MSRKRILSPTWLLPLVLLALLGCLIPKGLPQGVSSGSSPLPSLQVVEPDFKFVAFGDNRTGGQDPLEVTSTYKRIVFEMNQLQPDFVVLGGDIIAGYSSDENQIRKMWEEWQKATAALSVPLFKVVGNHDVWNEASRKIYQETFNEPLYYSFDYRGCHFVVLCSEIPSGKIDDQQFNWLKGDLGQNQEAKHTFLFIHQPLWHSAPDQWGRVHGILKEHHVDAVFAGHVHAYGAEKIDGIRYIITGGAGAPLRGKPPEAGGFYHYCLVSVQGDKVTIAVIKPGNIEAEDVVPADKTFK